jgi:dynein intermediate chain
MSSVQQRKNEILAKRAKLAELKKQRELRQKEFSNNRNSIGDTSEVTPPEHGFYQARSQSDCHLFRLFRRCLVVLIAEPNSMT